ncbi:hypothetical protein AB0N62_43285 [Streptomyces sp. NPDC093982]|uniref:hypothetical protein n=1 Tax=Streptomyces sp. NPDC093982 TaxID=3155077 RepID=UPI00343C8D53
MAGKRRRPSTISRKKQALKAGVIAAPLTAGLMIGVATSASADEFNQESSQLYAQDTQHLGVQTSSPGKPHAREKRMALNLFTGDPLVDMEAPGFTISGESPLPGIYGGFRAGYTPTEGALIEGHSGVKAEMDLQVANLGVGKAGYYAGLSTQKGVYGGLEGEIGPTASVGDPTGFFSTGAGAKISATEDLGGNVEVKGSAEIHSPWAKQSTEATLYTYNQQEEAQRLMAMD